MVLNSKSSGLIQMKNRYPIYVVSKGRWANTLTPKSLAKLGLTCYIVVEAHEFDYYNDRCLEGNTVIVLPDHYLDEYDTCDDLGRTKSVGPGAARNFCKDHSQSNGFNRHWVLDDNIEEFYRLNTNLKRKVRCGSTFAAAEDFVDRYTNVPVAGMNYHTFCKSTDPVPAYKKNTRIYSCLLIDNNSPYRWRGRYNEDTDLSLRVLKDGNCTIQFNAFLCGKVTTQRMRGGNSKEFYDHEGTLAKSQMLVDLHPDVAKLTWKFGRVHHHVDYTKFEKNLLIKKGNRAYTGVNEYGMVLK